MPGPSGVLLTVRENSPENVRPDYKNLLNLLDSKAAQYANSQIDYESRAYTDFEW